MDIIAIKQQIIGQQNINTVSARDLHKFLESKQDFSTWIKNRIEKYDFIENINFIRLHKKMEANNATLIEYFLSIEMAKELSMVENNEKGKEARKYFIECEKKYNSIIIKYDIPQTYADALLLAANQAKQLELQAPKVQFADTVQASKIVIDFKDLAKLISDNVVKIGRNNLMKLLRDRGFLNLDNTPSQKSINAELMQAVETTWLNDKTKEIELNVVAKITGKGQIYFCNNVRKFLTNKGD